MHKSHRMCDGESAAVQKNLDRRRTGSPGTIIRHVPMPDALNDMKSRRVRR